MFCFLSDVQVHGGFVQEVSLLAKKSRSWLTICWSPSNCSDNGDRALGDFVRRQAKTPSG